MARKKSNTKKKVCKKGFQCGRTCINRQRTCFSNLGKDGKKIVENYAQFVKRIAEEKAKASAPAPPTSNLPSRPSLLEGENKLITGTKIDLSTMLDSREALPRDKLARKENIKSRLSQGKATPSTGAELQQIADKIKPKLAGESIDYKVKDSIDRMNEDTLIEADDRSIDLVANNHNGLKFEVAWETKPETLSKIKELTDSGNLEEAAKVSKRAAFEAAKKWKKEILSEIPDGSIILNAPLGGSLGARSKSYMRQGFGVPDSLNEQHAIKIDGKLVPINLARPEEDLVKAINGEDGLDLKDLRVNEDDIGAGSGINDAPTTAARPRAGTPRRSALFRPNFQRAQGASSLLQNMLARARGQTQAPVQPVEPPKPARPALRPNEADILDNSKLDLNTIGKVPRSEITDKFKSNTVEKIDFEGAERLLESLKSKSKGKDILYDVFTYPESENYSEVFKGADKRSVDLLAKHYNDGRALVGWKLDKKTESRLKKLKEEGNTEESNRLGKKAALEATRKWKKDLLPLIPDGTLIENMPFGGALGARAKAYMRQGFGIVDKDGMQYSLKIGGKLVPVNLDRPPNTIEAALKGENVDISGHRYN